MTSLSCPGRAARWPQVLMAVVAALTAVVGVAPRAGAQSGGVAATIVSQTLLLQPDQTGSVVLDVAGTLPADTEVAVIVHNPLPADRAALRAATEGDISTGPYRLLVTPIDAVPRDPSGRLAVPVPTTSTRSVRGTEIPLRTAGVYPLEIVLRAGDRGRDLARVVTFLVRLPAEPLAEPLQVALVLPLTGPPSLQPDGSVVIDGDLRARLQLLLDTLAAAPDLAFSLRVQPELLEALGRTGVPTDTELRNRLVSVLATRQVLPSPYVAIDATAAVRAGLGEELIAQLRRGEDVLASHLGVGAASRTIWSTSDGLDDTTLGFLRDLGFQQAVIPASALEPVEETGGASTRPVSVRAEGSERPLTVGVADAALSDAFTAHAEPRRAAYAWLAELALLALSADEAAEAPAGVVVQPDGWADDPTFFAAVVAGLRSNPLVRPVTVEQYFEQVPPGTEGSGTTERALAPVEAEDLSDYARQRAEAQLALMSYGSMLPEGETLTTELSELLWVSAASTLTPPARAAYLTSVGRQLQELRDAIEPIPARTITLAGRTTELPITVTSRGDQPLQVKLRLRSSKLSFPEGNERVVTITDGVAPVRVPVEARASGTFPVAIDILTPVGDQVVAPSSRLTVRSTGFGGLGLALSVGALVVLALWWLRHVVHVRRARRASAGGTSGGGGPGPGTPGGAH